MNFWPLLSWEWWTIWTALLNKSCSEWCSEHHALFTFSLQAPVRELQGRPLKFSFYNVSKTVKNLWSLIEQKMLEMTRPFERYQEIGAGPLNKGPRRGWRFWHISFELFICWHRYHKRNCSSWRSLSDQMDIWVIYDVIRDFKGYERGLAPKMCLFFIAKIA